MDTAKAVRTSIVTAALLTGIAVCGPAWGQSDDSAGQRESVLQRVERLERELEELKALLTQMSQERVEQTAKDRAYSENAQDRDSGTAGSKANAPGQKPAARQRTAGWNLGGYAKTGFVASDASENDAFTGASFNPTFQFQYKDFLLLESELEVEVESDGETEVELEYAQFDLFLHDSVTLVLGKFLSPIGQFQERLHPAWVNKFPNAPAGFGHDGAQPESNVGAQLRGGIPMGATTLTYALAVGNGPRLGHEGGTELEGFGGDNNSNKSVGGRIGFLPLPYLEIGVSYMTAKLSGEEGFGALEPTTADFKLWGADAAYTRGPWDVRFEYLKSKRGALLSATEESPIVSMLPRFSLEAWYAQIAYRLSKVGNSRFLQNFEPVIRYGEFRANGNEEAEELAEKRFNIGLNYWLAPSAVMKGSVEWRNFLDPNAGNDTRFEFQFAYGF